MITKIIKQIDKKFFSEFLKKKIHVYYKKKSNQNRRYNYRTRKIGNLNNYKKLTYWNNLFNHLLINNVEGDIVECGVGNGQTLSFILFNLCYNDKLYNKKYIGFDSFEGFPEPSIEDNSPRNPMKGQWSHTDENFVLENLNLMGFKDSDKKKIKLIKGFFDTTFHQEIKNISKISLLHIDCDLYSSTKISLETWFDKIEKKGIIVFDEYLNSVDSFPGAKKAIDEFLGEDKNKIKVCPYTKKYYFIKS